MEETGICAPRAALRLAGAMRGALTPLLAQLAASGQDGAPQAAAYRLLRTAQNLECYARLARPLAAGRCVDLAALCTALCEAAQHSCLHRRLRPALAARGGVLPVAVPAWVLATVVLNLLDNALLYGGPQPAVRLEVSRQGRSAVLTVRDKGPGIPAAAQGRVFAPFSARPGQVRIKACQPGGSPDERGAASPGCAWAPSQALLGSLPGLLPPLRGGSSPASPSQRGAGLGLSLAAMAARQAGGVCSLASRPGRGTAVALALPLREGVMPGPCPTAAELLADRYSPVYVQLCQVCVLPD